MQDDPTKREQAQQLQNKLYNGGLSRRGFLERIKLLGAGFGAAYVLGIRQVDAAVQSDAVVNLKSTNAALNHIIEEGRQDPRLDQNGRSADPELDGPPIQTAQYGRLYGRYGRVYGRIIPYARLYGRYGRFYNRFYARF